MNLEQIKELIKEPLLEVEKYLSTIIEAIPEERTLEYMKYFMRGSAHRLRPMLLLLSYKVFSQEYDYDLIKLATAMELLHTASLVHDDVIDEAQVRRGQNSLNKLLGNKTSILIGNVFYLQAFKITSEFPSFIYFQTMLNTSGQMCFGEIIQSESFETALDKEKYLDIIKRKTALLIAASCSLGARLAKASEEEISTMEELGLLLGYLYQLRDDLKDWDVKLNPDIDINRVINDFHLEFKRKLDEISSNNICKDALISLENIIINS